MTSLGLGIAWDVQPVLLWQGITENDFPTEGPQNHSPGRHAMNSTPKSSTRDDTVGLCKSSVGFIAVHGELWHFSRHKNQRRNSNLGC